MSREIAALDHALERAGEDVILRRVVGQAPNSANIDVTIRAAVRSYNPEELVGGISQTDSKVIISPTGIAAAQWPGGTPTGATIDPSLPRRLDKVVIAGRIRNIEVVDPIYVQNELVRIEMRVLG